MLGNSATNGGQDGIGKITAIGSDLRVERDGYEWRRIDGRWQMLANSGNWFDCKIQDPAVARQVADYEYCLRPYAYEEGPDYPKGRKKGESVSEFIRRLQLVELRRDCKNIFAPVALKRPPIPAPTSIARLFTPYSKKFRERLTA